MTLFLASVAVALVVSFLCSLMEAALLSLTPAQIARLGERHPRTAELWRSFKSNIERPIAIILILNTTAHTIGASVAGSEFDELWGDQWIWAFSLGLTFVMLQFTEILPKTLGVRYNERLAVLVARPLQLAVIVSAPLISVLHLINRPFEGRRTQGAGASTLADIASLAAHARISKDIDAHQERIIQGAARLSSRTVRDLMIPMEQVVTLSTAQSLGKAVLAAHLDAHTRFPVCQDGDRDRVVGYVNFKEMIYFMSTNPADPSLNGIMRPVHFADPDGRASDLMRVFVDQHEHIAIVRGADGRSLGLVTLEDMMEELVGDLEDEFDRLPRYAHALSGGTWMFGGGVPMSEVSRTLGGRLGGPSGGGGENLASWIESRLGRVPTGGSSVRVNGLEVTVRRARRGRVFEASVVEVGPAAS
jgi:CBS domain containing-hemolysin-like protein